jgi:hypothetical protein
MPENSPVLGLPPKTDEPAAAPAPNAGEPALFSAEPANEANVGAPAASEANDGALDASAPNPPPEEEPGVVDELKLNPAKGLGFGASSFFSSSLRGSTTCNDRKRPVSSLLSGETPTRSFYLLFAVSTDVRVDVGYVKHR